MALYLLNHAAVRALSAIAAKAGAAIMEIYDQPESWRIDMKSDASPLTQADLRANQIIVAALAKLAPEIPVLSEESPWLDGDAATYWAVDPLDGTKEFLNRNGEFTVNIALVIKGVTRMGVICAPALKTLWAGVCDGVAKDNVTSSDCISTLNSWACSARFDSFDGLSVADLDWSAIHVASTLSGSQDHLRLLVSRSHGNDKYPNWICRILKNAKLIERGSSLKFCLIAQGDADIYVRMGPTSIWDTAAGQAILVAAGGAVVDTETNAELLYCDPRLVLNPDFIAFAPERIGSGGNTTVG